MRVVSLLPAATEIVAALGMLDQLVGVSHECDYPVEVQAKPRVTRCAIHGGALASEEVDRWVSATLAGTGTLYTLDEALVRRLEPDVRMGEDAAGVPWEAVVAAAPEVLVLACCGYDLARTMADVPLLGARPGWEQLPAVRAGQVYAVDGSAYFSRPGPRLVDSLEMLAEILHPELFAGRFPARAVRRLAPHELAGG